MEFPYSTTTRSGLQVTLTGKYDGYKKKLVGIIHMDGINFPAGWLEGGHYTSPEIEHAFDISLPEQIRSKGS